MARVVAGGQYLDATLTAYRIAVYDIDLPPEKRHLFTDVVWVVVEYRVGGSTWEVLPSVLNTDDGYVDLTVPAAFFGTTRSLRVTASTGGPWSWEWGF